MAAFHPELSDDRRLHDRFLQEVMSSMSGHSKWATIKHQKGAKDKARGKLFAKLIRQVEVAAREGGGDLEANATLRTMFDKARAASVPIDTIERAIKRGTGELEGVTYESITYEGYAPGGVAVLVDVLTDNRNRTGAEVRSVFSKHGRLDGRARRGVVAVRPQGRGPGAAVGQRGRRDARRARRRRRGHRRRRRRRGGVTCEPQATSRRCARRSRRAGIDGPVGRVDHGVRRPPCRSTDAEDAKKVLRIIDALEDNDDVQDVYSNFDITRGSVPLAVRREQPKRLEQCRSGSGAFPTARRGW